MPWTQAVFSFLAAATALALLVVWMSTPYQEESEGLRVPLVLLGGAMLAFAAMAIMLTD